MKNSIRNMKTLACFAGCLSLLLPAVPVQAQQNQILELAFDSRTSYGGSPNQTGPVISAGQYTVGVSIGVPSQGSATVACYDSSNYSQLFLSRPKPANSRSPSVHAAEWATRDLLFRFV